MEWALHAEQRRQELTELEGGRELELPELLLSTATNLWLVSLILPRRHGERFTIKKEKKIFPHKQY
jgi:hypothetical protein